ncbi:uncharacterized protein BXIN_1952 [Babesia sp. Xinjiang]|uniref:uncharacterized protein n=1 Tax=Babesia sp. Xinjiang TaxID=462227 RepID=UPI000A23088A|nr:uncharacterized protein BXIN_1952 [Babesia sp. Xinjiang]ORM40455.1 hypothetical protein BXIN_1952 [Babesia sp. Xinjiang]
MAQLPWRVLRSRPVTFAKARLAAERCSEDLSQLLDSHGTRTRVTSLLQAFIEALQECEANSYVRDSTKYVPCVKGFKVRGVVQIHPSFLGNPLKGVYVYLSNFLMQYNDYVGGIWLTCGKICQLDKYGYVTDGDCLGILSLRITVKLLVFVPQNGLMFGKVVRTLPERASLLVYGIFGVTVRSAEGSRDQANTLKEGDLVDADVDQVKILQKNKWVMLATSVDRVKVIS